MCYLSASYWSWFSNSWRVCYYLMYSFIFVTFMLVISDPYWNSDHTSISALSLIGMVIWYCWFPFTIWLKYTCIKVFWVFSSFFPSIISWAQCWGNNGTLSVCVEYWSVNVLLATLRANSRSLVDWCNSSFHCHHEFSIGWMHFGLFSVSIESLLLVSETLGGWICLVDYCRSPTTSTYQDVSWFIFKVHHALDISLVALSTRVICIWYICCMYLLHSALES